MKKLTTLSLLLLVLVTTVGCNKSEKREVVTKRLARGQSAYANIVDGMVGQLNVNNSGQWGYITAPSSWNPSSFDAEVKGLMSATLPFAEMGTVEAFAGGRTGVMFQGAIRATVTAAGVTNADLSSAMLRVAIWDSLAGTNDASGKLIPEYPIDMIGATGMANGQNINLTFADNFGTITFVGQIIGNRFEGDVRYNNLVSAEPSMAPKVSNLGRFSIIACDFFVCN